MAEETVTVRGAEELRLKLGRVLDPFETAMTKLAAYVHQQARTYSKPHAADKGTLGNAIKVEFAGKGVALSADVYVPRLGSHGAKGIAEQIEEGRTGGGKPPPVKAIKRWAVAHGIVTSYFLLAKKIGKEGTKGIHFMARAAEDGTRKAQELVGQVKVTIEENWGK